MPAIAMVSSRMTDGEPSWRRFTVACAPGYSIRVRDRVPHERPELRPYQRDVIAEFDRTREHKRRIILVAPTGAGKTVIGADIIRSFVRRAKSVLVLAHRREIIAQTSEKLHAAGISHGIIQAGFQGRPLELVQVASIQTLWARAIHRGTMDLPPVDLLVVDECHHTPARTYRKIIDAYPNATLLGLTATPCRGDGRGLGGIFETHHRVPAGRRTDRARLSRPDARLCADRSRPERRPHVGRRLCRRRNSLSAWTAPN